MTFEINSIFPTPVMTAKLDRDFTEEEFNFFTSLELRENTYNRGSYNHRVLDHPVMGGLRQILQSYLEDFLTRVDNPGDKVSPYITQSWVNFTEKGQSHHLHSHPNSYYSGVLYIQASPEIDRIYFHRDQSYMLRMEPLEYNLFNSAAWFFPVETGKLFLFPSSLSHEVKKVENDQVRISLSFNSFLRGSFGVEENLTYLHLT
jgi:uncharacterized protein (TIGR02466 family)